MLRSSAILMIVLMLAASVAVSSATNTTVPVKLPAPGSEQGYFLINSVPSGGDVYFDSAFWGETPVLVTVSATGTPTHTIRITLPGYEEWTSTYNGNPMAGQTIPITAQLVPSAQTGNIQVVSTPSGAMVSLDRSLSAFTPNVFYNIPVGSHEVSVFMSGYQTFYTSVNVNKGQTAYVNAILQPESTTGTLSVSSSPRGAAVYVDGIYHGVTSTTVGNLIPGTHSVRLSKAGYLDWTGSVSVSAGSTTYLDPSLVKDQQPQYATVSIRSNPAGASVYGDGVYVGQTRDGGPLVFTSVKPGTHTLLLTKLGYQDFSVTRTVSAGQNYDVDVTLNPVLNPTTGGISIISAPSQAEVYLNNAYKGLTPVTLDSLTPGSYTVLIRLSGYQDWQATQQVTAGQTAQISATLTPSATPTPTQSGLLPLVVLAGIAIASLSVGKRS